MVVTHKQIYRRYNTSAMNHHYSVCFTIHFAQVSEYCLKGFCVSFFITLLDRSDQNKPTKSKAAKLKLFNSTTGRSVVNQHLQPSQSGVGSHFRSTPTYFSQNVAKAQFV